MFLTNSASMAVFSTSPLFSVLLVSLLLSPRTWTCQDGVRKSCWWIGRTQSLATLVGGVLRASHIGSVLY